MLNHIGERNCRGVWVYALLVYVFKYKYVPKYIYPNPGSNQNLTNIYRCGTMPLGAVRPAWRSLGWHKTPAVRTQQVLRSAVKVLACLDLQTYTQITDTQSYTIIFRPAQRLNSGSFNLVCDQSTNRGNYLKQGGLGF